MACFVVPAVEAIVVSAAKSQVSKEKETENPTKVPLSVKLTWLRNLLIGGSILLAFEHVWHGEVVPWFPFLTAMADPESTAEMFHEMATVGVTMAVLVTLGWGVLCFLADAKLKSEKKTVEA